MISTFTMFKLSPCLGHLKDVADSQTQAHRRDGAAVVAHQCSAAKSYTAVATQKNIAAFAIHAISAVDICAVSSESGTRLAMTTQARATWVNENAMSCHTDVGS